VQEKYLATIACNIYIYRILQLIVFLTLSHLSKTSNRAVTHTSYKTYENRCVLLKSDMHVRPIRFIVLCTPANSSDKTQLMCSTRTVTSLGHQVWGEEFSERGPIFLNYVQ